MASSKFLKDLASRLTTNDLAELTARLILRETVEMNTEMLRDTGNDTETRTGCLGAITFPDSLVEAAADGIYNSLTDEFFQDVSEKMVKYAKEYVK